MNESARLPRKLAAILYADVAGYSRLTGEDEDATHRRLSEYLDLISSTVEGHRGRVMHYAGDAVLAMFEAVADALSCAAHVQQDLGILNRDLPDDRKVQFRIGLNMGDVIEDRGDIYGDGVNIAARLEALAEPGGICISESVRTAVGNKLPMDYEYMGEQQVKNIVSPVKAYHARLMADAELPVPPPTDPTEKAQPRSRTPTMVGISVAIVAAVILGLLTYWKPWQPVEEPASIERMAFPLPEEPSIVVLPFESLSGDSEQDYVADGLTENIIAALAKVPEMFVIARSSAFTYKNKATKGRQVSEDLGVRYVLKGSVQTAGDGLRVTANLLDAMTGRHVWSERYDRSMAELFSVQDDITREIVGSLQVELTDGEQARVVYSSTRNLDAWASVVRATGLIARFTKADNAKARGLAENAIRLDPEYASGWTTLAWTHWIDMRFGFSASREKSFGRAVELATKAAILDPELSSAQSLLGSIHLARREYDQAIAKGRRAIDLSPNGADDHALLALTEYYVGNWRDSIELLQRAMRLSPHYPSWYLLYLGRAQTFKGSYEDAIATHETGLTRAESSDMRAGFHAALAFAHIAAGDEQLAREHMAQRMKLMRNSSVHKVKKRAFFKDEDDLNRLLDALRKAGLPETPPPSLPDKPSIAVLAFTNMSGDAEQEYLSDGLSENIITELSRFRELFVIARHSSFSYKGKPVNILQISTELGVRYVVEGSLQRADDRVRVTVQLIDASDGKHLWAERYDRHLTDVFAIQDEIVRTVVASIAEEVQMAEGERALREHPNNLQAFEYALRGRKLLRMIDKQATGQARQMYENARKIAPRYAEAYEGLAKVYNYAYRWRFLESVSREEAVKLGCEMAQKAVALAPFWYRGHWVLANCHMFRKELDQSLAEYERALELNPNSSEVRAAVGEPLVYLGRAEEAIAGYKAAIRLNPHHPDWFLWQMGWAQYLAGEYETALATIRRMNRMPNAVRRTLAPILVRLGRLEEARAVMAEFIENSPDYTLEHVSAFPFRHREYLERWIEDLRIAGMPETQPPQ